MKSDNKNIMEMLREIRNQHSNESLNKSWEELQRENRESVEKYQQMSREIHLKKEKQKI